MRKWVQFFLTANWAKLLTGNQGWAVVWSPVASQNLLSVCVFIILFSHETLRYYLQYAGDINVACVYRGWLHLCHSTNIIQHLDTVDVWRTTAAAFHIFCESFSLVPSLRKQNVVHTVSGNIDTDSVLDWELNVETIILFYQELTEIQAVLS